MSARILVVDDEKNIRTTLTDILEDEGYLVATADSGERALKLCARERFDVVLLDVRMPGIDGVETFRRIRRNRAGTRVIMMSAYSVAKIEELVLEEGALGFIRKPLDVVRMLDLIRLNAPGNHGSATC